LRNNGKKTKTKLNISLIFTDQQRWDTMKTYNNNKIKTPDLDLLAYEGVVFYNVITLCP